MIGIKIMDTNFNKMHKILSGLKERTMSSLLNSSGDEIKEMSIFNEDGSFNQELLTKEGFVKNLIDSGNEKMKNIYESLYDAIANLNDDGKMSEDELKFIASFGKNSDKNTISKDDFYDLGLIGRNINKYTKENSYSEELHEFLDKPEANITPSQKVEQPEKITAVNNELKINGKIDEPVIQGNVGDCWLLSGINALNSTDKGKEIIRNSIIPNDDGTVTVNFAGVQKQITITPDEIKQYDTDTNFQDMYSNGDNDALVLEIGMRKLIKENPKLFLGLDTDISGGQTFNFWKALIPNYNIMHIADNYEKPEIAEDGGIIGKCGVSDMYAKKIKEIFENALENKNIAIEFSTDGHSMAITEVTENEVTYIDSMNYTKTTLSWDKFINSGVSELSYTDLSND